MAIDRDLMLGKTDKGRAEIESRAHGLPMGVRKVLILADGKHTAAEILASAGASEQSEAALELLVQDGFVAPVGAGAAVPAPGATQGAGGKAALLDLARTLLGDRAERVVKKIEETEDTPAALAGAVDACRKLIRLVIDESKADEFAAKAAAVLGRKMSG